MLSIQTGDSINCGLAEATAKEAATHSEKVASSESEASTPASYAESAEHGVEPQKQSEEEEESSNCEEEPAEQTIATTRRKKRDNRAISSDIKRRKLAATTSLSRKDLPPPPSHTVYLGGINGPGSKQQGLSTAVLTVTDVCTHLRGMGVCRKPLIAVRLQPERSCCFVDFADAVDALAFFVRCYGGSDEPPEFYHVRRIINIAGIELRSGWAKPTKEQPNVALAIRNGATRCVFLHPVEEGSERLLASIFAGYGPIDSVRVVGEKNIGFVHLASTQAAMQAVSALSATKRWRRVSFGTDRVCISAAEDEHAGSTSDHPVKRLFVKKSEQAPHIENRTVFLGGVPKECTLNDLCNIIRAGGPILSIRLAKGSAFVTFVEASAAQSLYDFADRYGVVVHGKRLAVGWGKPVDGSIGAGALSFAVTNMLRQGATRNLCIVNLDALDAHQLAFASTISTHSSEYTTNDTYHDALDRFFSSFGAIECINVVHQHQHGSSKGRMAFINFSSIMEAARALENARKDDRFEKCRLVYGRDRCAQTIRAAASEAPSHTNSMLPQAMSAVSLNNTAPFHPHYYYHEDPFTVFPENAAPPTNLMMMMMMPPSSAISPSVMMPHPPPHFYYSPPIYPPPPQHHPLYYPPHPYMVMPPPPSPSTTLHAYPPPFYSPYITDGIAHAMHPTTSMSAQLPPTRPLPASPTRGTNGDKSNVEEMHPPT